MTPSVTHFVIVSLVHSTAPTHSFSTHQSVFLSFLQMLGDVASVSQHFGLIFQLAFDTERRTVEVQVSLKVEKVHYWISQT